MVANAFETTTSKMNVKMVHWINLVIVEGSNRYLPKSVPL